MPLRYSGELRPGSHSPFLASILRPFDAMGATAETFTFLASDEYFDPVRNPDLHRAELDTACIVTADAIAARLFDRP